MKTDTNNIENFKIEKKNTENGENKYDINELLFLKTKNNNTGIINNTLMGSKSKTLRKKYIKNSHMNQKYNNQNKNNLPVYIPNIPSQKKNNKIIKVNKNNELSIRHKEFNNSIIKKIIKSENTLNNKYENNKYENNKSIIRWSVELPPIDIKRDNSLIENDDNMQKENLLNTNINNYENNNDIYMDDILSMDSTNEYNDELIAKNDIFEKGDDNNSNYDINENDIIDEIMS